MVVFAFVTTEGAAAGLYTTCVSKLSGLKVIARLSPTTAKLAVTLGSGLGVVLTLGSNVVVVVVGAG